MTTEQLKAFARPILTSARFFHPEITDEQIEDALERVVSPKEHAAVKKALRRRALRAILEDSRTSPQTYVQEYDVGRGAE